MATNTLSDARCRGVKPTDKAQKIFDGGGLHLFVSPTGAKVWRLAYRVGGKAQTMSVGPYPVVSLSEARAKRDEVAATLRAGADPKAETRRAPAGVKFAQAVADFWGGRKDLSAGYVANATRGLEMHLIPKLGELPIADITREHLLTELNRMDAAGLHSYVRKVRMWAGQVFEWAIEQGHAKDNPTLTINPKKAFGRQKVEHFAALELNQVPGLLRRLSMERELQSVLACKMLALTWVRTKELRQMQWGQIDGDLWRVPAAVMKKDRDHLVPLSRQALALLAKLKARSRGGIYVFPHDRRDDRTMSENTVLYLLWGIGFKGQMTGHGFRTVASTWANENGQSSDAIERQLAHAPDDKVRAAYNRAEYMPERRAMMQAWADWLDLQVDAGGAQGGQAPAARAE